MTVLKLKDGREVTLSYDWISLRRVEQLAGKPFHKVVGDFGAIDMAALIGGGVYPEMKEHLLEEIGELIDMDSWVQYSEKIASALKRDLHVGTPAPVLQLVRKEDDDADPRS
jgi:hypothetical protein